MIQTSLVTVRLRDDDYTKAYQLDDIDLRRIQDLNKATGNAFEITVHSYIGKDAEDVLSDFDELDEADAEERRADIQWAKADAAYDIRWEAA